MNDSDPERGLVYRVIHKLASMLLARGFVVGDFVGIAKTAFVGAAAERIHIRGGRVSTSEIAVMTGLSRAEVAGIRAQSESRSLSTVPSRAERVMHGWHDDPELVDGDGLPKPLPAKGPISFASLIKRYAGDVTPNAVKRELAAGRMIRTAPSGDLVAVGRYYHSPIGAEADLRRLADALEIVLANAQSMDNRPESSMRFVSVRFDGTMSLAIQKNVSVRIERFMNALSEYLHSSTRSTNRTDKASDPQTIRVLVAQATVNDRRSKI